MASVSLYDHRPGPLTDVGGIGIDDLRNAAPAGINFIEGRDRWEEASYVIGHFLSSKLKQLLSESYVTAGPDGQIVLCVTTERPGFGIGSFKVCDKKVEAGGKIRYILFARYVNALEESEVARAFYRSDASQAESIVNGEYHKLPTELQRLFCTRRFEYLSALAILCQGYLAVHAEKEGDEWGPPEIKDAIKQMGWPAFVDSRGPGTHLLGSDLASKRGVVSDPGWWSNIFEGAQTEVERGIAREWGVDDINSCPALKNLVDAIYGTGSIAPAVVANAYCAIVEKQGGKPCSQA